MENYLDQLWRTITTELEYPLDFPAPVALLLYVGIAIGGGALFVLLLRPARGDPYFSLMKAAIPAGSNCAVRSY